ncbi:MAG: hypothetical protein H6581_00235 [Bacteroidia bacterium]|nr:hypothetical protein [Bacteroidia bacterium]
MKTLWKIPLILAIPLLVSSSGLLEIEQQTHFQQPVTSTNTRELPEIATDSIQTIPGHGSEAQASH